MALRKVHVWEDVMCVNDVEDGERKKEKSKKSFSFFDFKRMMRYGPHTCCRDFFPLEAENNEKCRSMKKTDLTSTLL